MYMLCAHVHSHVHVHTHVHAHVYAQIHVHVHEYCMRVRMWTIGGHSRGAAVERERGSARRHSAWLAPDPMPPDSLALMSTKPGSHLQAAIVETLSAPAVPAWRGHWRHALMPDAPFIGL